MLSRHTHAIAITTGDTDGIGLEVTVKALERLSAKGGPALKGIQFVVFKDAHTPKHLRSRIQKMENTKKYRHIEWVTSRSTSPANWVEAATNACLNGDFAALVTGPLSKTTIQHSGLSDIGHTDILKRLTGTKSVHMGFIGDHFNVVLATGHVPISDLKKNISVQNLSSGFSACLELCRHLPKSRARKPIAVVGLNPHAGESGLIGNEEKTVFKKFFASPIYKNYLSSLRVSQYAHLQHLPLVPDAAFMQANWDKYSCYLSPYHDQALIPFKLIHGFKSGVHISLGLPILRVSVDHGTAKDIFDKDVAECGSMHRSLLLAMQSVRRKKNGF